MAKIIEAKARIVGEETLSPMLDKLAKKFDAIEKSAKGAAGVDKVAASIAKISKEMQAIDKFNSSKGVAGVNAAKERLLIAQQTAAATAKAVKAAEEGSKDRAKAEADHKRAVANARAATRAFEQERTAAVSAMRGLDQAGIAAGRVADRQRQIASAVDKATAALDRQDRVQRRHSSRDGSLGHFLRNSAATYVSAHGVAHGIKSTALAGAQLQHERVALRNAGRTPDEMREIEEASSATTKSVPTSTFTENLKVINETTGAFGSLHHAIENLPFMQKSASVLHAAAGDKIHESAGELGNKLARFFEERQVAGDTATFQREAEGLIRAMAFTRGNFNPAEAMNFAQQAKSSLPNYSERFLTKVAPSLVTMLGGHRAGTAANAFTSVVMGKVNDAKQAEEWMRYGLLDPKQAMMKAGHAVGWRAGAVKDTNLALSDPLRWVEEVMLPAMKAKGINTDDRLSLSKALGTMFRNQNANVWANDLAQPASRSRLHKDEANINQAGTLDEIYQRNLSDDPTVAITTMTAALNNLMATASSPAMKTAAAGITWIGEALQTTALWGKENPKSALSIGAGAAAAGLTGTGIMAYKMYTGFGLTGSAAALDGSAAALTRAAIALGGSNVATKAAPAVAASWAARAVPFIGYGATAASVAYGLYGMYDTTTPFAGLNSGERMKNWRGGSMSDVYRKSFNEDRDRLGIPALGQTGAGAPVKAELTGSAKVTGEAKITIDIPGVGSRVVNVPLGGVLTNGPGSLGTSSPDASAHPVGVGHN